MGGIKMSKKYDEKEAKEIVKNCQDGNYRLITYNGMSGSAILFHIPCESTINITRLKNFTNDNRGRCKVCYPKEFGGPRKRLSEKEFIIKMKNKLGSSYKYLGGFKNMGTLVKMEHTKCNTIFNKEPTRLLGKKPSLCPFCANNNRGKYSQRKDYLESLLNNALDGDDYKWNESYKGNNKIKHSILHKKCGNIFNIRPNDFQQGYRCSICTSGSSKEELFIYNYLKNNQIKFKKNKKFPNCKIKLPLPFDFFLAGNIIIEFDGEQHFFKGWNKPLSYQFKYDSIKNDYMFKRKVVFIRIHYKLNQSDISKILDEVIQSSKLSEETIKKYTLLVKQNGKIYNKEKYYTNMNKNYFKHILLDN